MSDIVIFIEKDFYFVVYIVFEYIFIIGRLKIDCRIDIDFEKKWYLELISI